MSDNETIELSFDPDDMTAADLVYIEEYSGCSFAEFATAEKLPPMKAMIAMVYVVLRKDDPSVKVEDVEQMKLNALIDTLGNTEARPSS